MKFGLLIGLVLAIAGGSYYFFFHPPVVMKRAAEKSLAEFAEAVESQDRAKVGEALNRLLTDDAKIRLEVSFLTFPRTDRPALIQDFPDKAAFLKFMDNVLYTLTDIHYQPVLERFELAQDKQSAQVKFTSKQWADGDSMVGGTSVGMRYSGEASCEGAAVFAPARLHSVTCKFALLSVPRQDQMQRLRSSDAVREMLQRESGAR